MEVSMSLPNANIASTFIESYITIRKAGWKLNVGDGGAIKVPEDETVKHKLTICLTLLEAFNNAKTFEDWIKILDDIYVRERAEFETHQQRFAIVRAMVNPPLAGNMLHAIRTYIVSELKHENEFKKLKDDLSHSKIELEKQILWDKHHGTSTTQIDANQKLLDSIDHTLETRNDRDEYFVQFFNETIITYDTDAKRFHEKSFDDLKLNVQKNKRILVICQHLLEDNAKKTTALAMTSSNNPLPTLLPANEQMQPTVDKDEKTNGTTDKNGTLPQPIRTYSSVVIEGNRKKQSSLQALSTFAKPEESTSVPRRQSVRIANSEHVSDSTYPSSKRHR